MPFLLWEFRHFDAGLTSLCAEPPQHSTILQTGTPTPHSDFSVAQGDCDWFKMNTNKPELFFISLVPERELVQLLADTALEKGLII